MRFTMSTVIRKLASSSSNRSSGGWAESFTGDDIDRRHEQVALAARVDAPIVVSHVTSPISLRLRLPPFNLPALVKQLLTMFCAL